MLKIILDGHDNFYGVCDVLRLFFEKPSERRDDGCVICENAPDITIRSVVDADGVRTFFENEKFDDTIKGVNVPVKREVKRQLYMLVSRMTGRSFPWGSLTGIRPTMVAAEVEEPKELEEKYLVREDKAKLAVETMKAENEVLSRQKEADLNVYVGVPFCPSRCAYCSFIAQDTKNHMDRLRDYGKALAGEAEILGKCAPEAASIYWGGGTPTVFDDKDFAWLSERIFSSIKRTSNAEITVEAGRPDTITRYKLEALRDCGVNRICINPQTMCDETLEKLNRKHTSQDVIDAFNLASGLGFDVINMDLIAGLSGQPESEFIESTKKLISLGPSNITIHTLYKKRRSSLSREEVLEGSSFSTDEAVSCAYELLYEAGYKPYYLYRQKDTAHGLENTGFSKSGTECIYNVAMMSDKRNVLAIGAGGMSKRVFAGNRVERCSCTKDVLEYIEKYEESAAKKIQFFEFN